MAVAWEHAWRALAARLCIPSRAQCAGGTTGALLEDDESPDALSPVPVCKQAVSRSGSRSSTELCAICLGGMRPGHGHALFTAECSHKFHFRCISSNVQHGNRACPICRAVWKHLPLPAKADATPLDWPDDQLPVSCAPDLSVFESKTTSGKREEDAVGASGVEVVSFAEFPYIQRSVTSEKFDILIHLKAPRPPAPSASSHTGAAIDILAVLDLSGSMAGNKLALLTRVLSFVIKSLGPNDRLSVIAFRHSAWSLFPFRKMTAAGRRHSFQALADGLPVAGGVSNVAEALRKAAWVTGDRQVRNPACSVLLLSDGLGGREAATWQCGRPSLVYDALVPRSICPGSGHHVRVHAFGLGAYQDSAVMRGIAEMSGGTFSSIDTVGEIPDVVGRYIGGLRSVVAQETRLSFHCAEQGVLLTCVASGGYASTVDGHKGGEFVDVGDLYAGEERNILVTVHVPTTHGKDSALLVPSCTYRVAVTMETVCIEGDTVIVHRPRHPVSPSPLSVEVERERHRISAMEGMAMAWNAVELGDFVHAAMILEGRRVELESWALLSVDAPTLALVAELREFQDRLGTRQRYKRSGRAYILAALNAHPWQCVTASGGDSGVLAGLTHTY
ncbi:hypothetical protein VPH35_001895 [Triticum aestivum]|uniref:E3 ubiquitin-protein ligase WAV3-like n=1 Tax=Triticum aestivum TaxID=4565 RepID=UPI0008426295|nr:E3 ubiquitin-protein ligase WAV3-like [Triticum aestivum]